MQPITNPTKVQQSKVSVLDNNASSSLRATRPVEEMKGIEFGTSIPF